MGLAQAHGPCLTGRRPGSAPGRHDDIGRLSTMRLSLLRGLDVASRFAVILGLAGAYGNQSRAQEQADGKEKEAERAAELEEMKQVMRSFKVVAIDDQGKETPATLVED